MNPEPRRYTFPPLERRGVLLGLNAGQLATLAAGALLSLAALRAGSTGGGLLASLAVAGVFAACACWPVAGRPPVLWLLAISGWVLRRGRGPRLSPQPLAGYPGGTATVSRRAGPGAAPRVAGLAGLRLRCAACRPGDEPLGIVVDKAAGTWACVVSVAGSSLALLDVEAKEGRLGAWGALLGSVARAGTPVHRLQWVEFTSAGTSDDLWAYMARAAVGGEGARRARKDYEQLIGDAGPATQLHHVVLVLSVNARLSGRAAKGFGRGQEAICQRLRREVRLLTGQLRSAELPRAAALGVQELEALLRMLVVGEGPRSASVVAGGSAIWPVASQEAWSAFRCDGAWYATYWIAEWPRLGVGPDFLTPLLACPGSRRVSMVMAPVDPARAAREARSARTADLADEELRRRVGFVPSVRRQREAEGVARREAELADGHAEYRFSGYVTVSAADRAQLVQRCAEVEQAALHAHLSLRLLYGRQEEAWCWTLPLGRGLS